MGSKEGHWERLSLEEGCGNNTQLIQCYQLLKPQSEESMFVKDRLEELSLTSSQRRILISMLVPWPEHCVSFVHCLGLPVGCSYLGGPLGAEWPH